MSDRVIDFRFAPKLTLTCIGLPDDEHKSLVRNDGSMQYGFDTVITFGLRHAAEPPRCSQRTESPESAVVLTTLDFGFATLALTTFAHADTAGRRSDVVLWELTSCATNRDALIGSVTITIDRAARAAVNAAMPAWSNELPVPPATPVESRGGPLLYSTPQRLGICNDYDRLGRYVYCTESTPVESGKTLRGAFVLPLDDAVEVPADLDGLCAARDAASKGWQSLAAMKSTIRVPDASVREMLASCARNILQARVIKGGLPFFQVGPLVYRGLWVVDGHFITEAARYLGHDADADLAWDALLKFRRDDGAITTHPHHTKETGIALATLVRMTELSGKWDRLRAAWPIVVRGAVDFIQRLRDDAAAMPPEHPCHRLLPESYGDGGIGGKRPEFTTSLWVLAGLRQLSLAARCLGTDDAAEIERMYADLLADFRRVAAKCSAATPTGQRFLPMAMRPDEHNLTTMPGAATGTPQLWTRIGPGVATWAFCHSIYPGEVFAPSDPLVTDLVALNDTLDDEEGIPKETGWMPWHGQWNYHASFAAHVALFADRPAKAIEYLYAMANHAAPTRVWREEQSLQSHPQSRYIGDMPHNWASAEFVRLVRNLLVFETGVELHFLRGMPREWIVADNPVIVERTPTRFGRASVKLRVDDAGHGSIAIDLDLSGPIRPTRVTVRLPAGASNITVDGNAATTRAGAASTIELPVRCRAEVGFLLSR